VADLGLDLSRDPIRVERLPAIPDDEHPFLTAGTVLLVWTRAFGSPLPTGREWWHAVR